jgi:hypothetical protein
LGIRIQDGKNDPQEFNFFPAVIFFNFWSLKPCIRIGLQPQPPEYPDPEKNEYGSETLKKATPASPLLPSLNGWL